MRKKFEETGIVIGARDVCFVELMEDDDEKLEYDEENIMSLPGLVEIALQVTVTTDSVPGDDNPAFETMSTIDEIKATTTVNYLGADAEAFLLGHKIDKNGALIKNGMDAPPKVAMGFRYYRTDGSYDYSWLLRGTFAPSDMTFRTREKGKTNWQQPKLTGTFTPRIHDGNLQHTLNTKNPKASKTILDAFFTKVYEPEFEATQAG